MFKRYTFAALISLSVSASVVANDDYQAWLQQTQSDFQTYLDENDKAFLNMLNEKWEEVEIKPAKVRDTQPKPVTIPVVADKKSKQPTPKPVKANNEKKITEKKIPVPSTPVISDSKKPRLDENMMQELERKPFDVEVSAQQKPKPVVPVVTAKPKANDLVHTFDFFGEKISIAADRKFKTAFYGKVNNQSIAEYWKRLATKPHKDIIDQLDKVAEKLALNSWGKAMLIDSFSRSLHGFGNSRKLTSWFLLMKSGYDVKVAYNSDIYLLLPAEQIVYGKTFFTLEGKRYYAIDFNKQSDAIGKVYTYGGSHSSGKEKLNFDQPNNFAVTSMPKERVLKFEYAKKQYEFKVHYSQQKINFYNSYPQLDLDNYFSSDLPASVKNELVSQLKPITNKMNKQDAVNFLLRFVQMAFEYQTDDQQFREENYLYPLETLHYPYSDCEDRSALFSWLVENLLNLR